MAKLVTFMYANEARNDNINGQSIQTINNPLLSLKPAFIPGQLSFSVICGITDFEFDKEHILQFRLIAPDGKVAVDTGSIQIPSNAGQVGIADGFIGNFDLRNVIFLTKGLYKNELIFDGVKLKEDEILVAEAGIDGGDNTI